MSKVKETKIDTALSEAKKETELDINNMPLKSLGDYIRYNDAARKKNKGLKINRYPMKPCPVELHPTDKVVFNRNDQPNNPLPVYISNSMIDFKKELIPGKTYVLPRCVIDHLASKGTAHWKWFDNADGSQETRIAYKDPRFSIRTVYER